MSLLSRDEFLALVAKENWEFLAGTGPMDGETTNAPNGYEEMEILQAGQEFMIAYQRNGEFSTSKHKGLRALLDQLLVAHYKPSVELAASLWKEDVRQTEG